MNEKIEQDTPEIAAFRRNLRLLIESRGMSAQSFCEKADIPPATISRYLTGAREPQIRIIMEIADYFNVSLDSLFDRTEKQRDDIPTDPVEFMSLYSRVGNEDKRIVNAILSKYNKI